MLNSDWLSTTFRFWARAECVRQCIKIGSGLNDSFWALWDSFEKIGFFVAGLSARIIIMARSNYDACG